MPDNTLPETPQERRVLENGRTGKDDVGRMDPPPGLLFEQTMRQTLMAVCISDPHQDDTPIVFANNAFLTMTGYARDEVIGQNCRFLQGADTDPATVDAIRGCIAREETAGFEILNYRKDGSPFWNALHIGPIYDETGALRFFFGSQWNVSEQVEAREQRLRHDILTRELQHRIGNIFAVVLSILRLSGRGGAADGLVKATDRIQALARAHEMTAGAEERDDSAGLKTLVEGVLQPYRNGDEDRIDTLGPPVELPSDLVVVVGLGVHELATNAVKYGALSAPQGRVVVSWRRVEEAAGEMLKIEWAETGGPAVTPPDRQGSGGRMVLGLLASVDARIDYEWHEEGLTAVMTLPLDRTG